MSKYEVDFHVYGYSQEVGELISAKEAEAAINEIVDDMQKDINKIKADAIRDAFYEGFKAAIHLSITKPSGDNLTASAIRVYALKAEEMANNAAHRYADKLERGEA